MVKEEFTRNVEKLMMPQKHPLRVLFERLLWISTVLVLSLGMLNIFMPTHAHADEDVDEVYSNDGATANTDDESAPDYGRIDVRLTRPDEAQERIADDGYAQVPGAERLNGIYVKSAESSDGRSIASSSPAKAESTPMQSMQTMQSMQPMQQRQPEQVSKSSQAINLSDIPDVGDDKKLPPAKVDAFSFRSNDIVNDEPKPVRAGVYQEVSVIVSDHGYYPNRVFVTEGIPVRMYLSTPSKNTLCVMIDKWGVKKGVMSGTVEEVNFMPDQAGNYRFYCPVKNIEGMLTVRSSNQLEPTGRNVATDASASNTTRDSSDQPYQNSEQFRTALKAPRPLKQLADDEESN